MKLKISLDRNAVQGFLLNHVEKIVFAGIGVGFLLFMWGAIGRETYNRPPGKLAEDAQAAVNKIELTSPESQSWTDWAEKARRIKEKIPVDPYETQVAWSPIIVPKPPMRHEPPLFPVRELRAAADRGQMPPDRNAVPALVGVGAGSQTTRGFRCVVLTGVIPIREQTEAYQKEFQGSQGYDPQRDVPQYPDMRYFRVERAEVAARAAGTLQFVPVDVAAVVEQSKEWAGQPGDLVEQESIDKRVALAVPQRIDRAWNPEVVQHPAIVGPSYDKVAQDPAAYQGQRVVWQGETTPPAAPMPATRAIFTLRLGNPSGMIMPVEGEEKYFAVDFPSAKAAEATRSKSITGIVQGQVQVSVAAVDPTTREHVVKQVTVPLLSYVGGVDEMMMATGSDVDMGFTPGPSGHGGGSLAPPMFGPAAGTAGTATAEEKGPEYWLFRFFDFSVEPGKRYRYRVKLLLRNPNFDVNQQLLDDDLKAKKSRVQEECRQLVAAGKRNEANQKWLDWWGIQTDWSDPSEAVEVPRDTTLLAISTMPPPRPHQEPYGKMMVVKWVDTTGEEAYKEFSAYRGMVPNFLGEKFPPETAKPKASGAGTPTRRRGGSDVDTGETSSAAIDAGSTAAAAAESFDVDYVTDAVVLDLRGGDRVPGSRVTRPGQILVMDRDGTLKVHDELADKEDYDRHKAPLETEKPTQFPGGMDVDTTPFQRGGGGVDVDNFD